DVAAIRAAAEAHAGDRRVRPDLRAVRVLRVELLAAIPLIERPTAEVAVDVEAPAARSGDRRVRERAVEGLARVLPIVELVRRPEERRRHRRAAGLVEHAEGQRNASGLDGEALRELMRIERPVQLDLVAVLATLAEPLLP